MTLPSTKQVNKLNVIVGKPVAMSGFNDVYVPLNTLADFLKSLTELFNRDAIDIT